MLPDAGDQFRKLVDDAGAVTETDHLPAGFNPSGPQPLHNRRSFMPINGFEADDLVVCAYRLPSPIQPWVGGVHVGRVLEPGDDPADWNGHNSERDYCQHTNRVPVAYCQDYPCGTCQQEGGFQQHDDADALTKIGAEQAALPVADKIRPFLGEDALAHYRHACGPLSPDAEGGCHEPYRPVR